MTNLEKLYLLEEWQASHDQLDARFDELGKQLREISDFEALLWLIEVCK